MPQLRKSHNILKPIVEAHRKRSNRREKHPIIDFLFEYYHFKPAKLLEWSPGIGVNLSGSAIDQFAGKKGFTQTAHGVYINPDLFPTERIEGLDWTIELLKQTAKRKPAFNCFGLHEWCMIYEQSDIRHPQLPLRLSHNDVRQISETHSVQCTHYDAYRFYSSSAKSFNRQPLIRESMQADEQPGCLHNNMDLYRWAYKFHPWVPSQLITRAFLLAIQIRHTDMRASPYDVSALTNSAPIKIETQQGKSEYVEQQKQYYKMAQPLRKLLLQSLCSLRMSLEEHQRTSI